MSDLHEMAECLRAMLRDEEIRKARLEEKSEHANVVCILLQQPRRDELEIPLSNELFKAMPCCCEENVLKHREQA